MHLFGYIYYGDSQVQDKHACVQLCNVEIFEIHISFIYTSSDANYLL